MYKIKLKYNKMCTFVLTKLKTYKHDERNYYFNTKLEQDSF